MELWGIAQQVAEATLAVLLPIVLAFVASWLRGVLQVWQSEFESRVGERRAYQINGIVSAAVAAAEQVGLKQDLADISAFKLDAALDFAQRLLTDNGIQLDLNALQALVEAEVMNQFNRPE